MNAWLLIAVFVLGLVALGGFFWTKTKGFGRHAWAGGTAPMLVLQGSEDVTVLPENAKRLAAEFPQRVTFVEIAHAGHALLPEQPDAIAKAVLAYLRR